MPDLTDPTPGVTEPPRKNSPQNKIITPYITASEIFLGVAGNDPEIRPGTTLVSTARSTLEDRAGGMGQQSLKTAELNAAIAQARNDYAQFREIARPSFPHQADRLALSLTGEVPEDTGRFVTLALASYGAAGKEPHATKLTRRGYSAGELSSLINTLYTLTGTSGSQDQAQGDAIGDTAARDAAYDALRAFMKELKGVAKGALRGKPALLAKLGL
ncbi:MAG TPA: hypothetical protein VF258_07440 [Luteolibacter sp.]